MLWLTLGICWIISMFSLSRSTSEADESLQAALQENSEVQSVSAHHVSGHTVVKSRKSA